MDNKLIFLERIESKRNNYLANLKVVAISIDHSGIDERELEAEAI